jgi:hypothetical protein
MTHVAGAVREAYMDSGTMMTAYRFTASGRQFAAPFAQRHSEIITNTQHTRSTLSHLQSFMTKLRTEAISVGDLMIAAKLSGEIIGDFNEIIEEIVEQRRALIASVNRKIQAAKQARTLWPPAAGRSQKWAVPTLRARGWLCYGPRIEAHRRVGTAHQMEKMSKPQWWAVPTLQRTSAIMAG